MIYTPRINKIKAIPYLELYNYAKDNGLTIDNEDYSQNKFIYDIFECQYTGRFIGPYNKREYINYFSIKKGRTHISLKENHYLVIESPESCFTLSAKEFTERYVPLEESNAPDQGARQETTPGEKP